jgi:hypothetical protein
MQTVFQFSFIFKQEIKQNDFFQATIYPCMEKFLKGDNLLIFSYGVTNSGKTYTMQGSAQEPGLIPRTLDFLFSSIQGHLETKREIYKYKPEKFNEITSLTESELTTELQYKEQLLKAGHPKVKRPKNPFLDVKIYTSSKIKILSLNKIQKGIERAESFQTLKDIDSKLDSATTAMATAMTSSGFSKLEASKKFGGSLDSPRLVRVRVPCVRCAATACQSSLEHIQECQVLRVVVVLRAVQQ